LAAAASTGDGAPSTPAAPSAHLSVAHLAVLPASPFSLHTYPNAKDLFASTLKRVAPMWFHPRTQDLDASQLTQTLPAQPDAPNVSVGSLSTMLGAAAAAPSFAAAATAAVAAVAAAMGLQGSHSMPSPFPAALGAYGFIDPSRWDPPLTPSASDLLGPNRARPFKSRSTKLQEAYERAPLHLDLLPYVLISNIPIAATESTPAIASVVICNQPKSSLILRTSSSAASPTAVATLAAMTSAAALPQRKGSTGLRVKSVKPLRKPPQSSDDAGASASPGPPAQESLLLELLGAANSVKREPNALDVSHEDSSDAAELSALDALASVADPLPAAIEFKQEAPKPMSSQVDSKADEATSVAAPAPAPPDPAAAPSAPSDQVLITMTQEELVEFQKFRAQSAAAAAIPAPTAVAIHHGGLGVSVGPHTYACLAITPRSGYLHSVMFGIPTHESPTHTQA